MGKESETLRSSDPYEAAAARCERVLSAEGFSVKTATRVIHNYNRLGIERIGEDREKAVGHFTKVSEFASRASKLATGQIEITAAEKFQKLSDGYQSLVHMLTQTEDPRTPADRAPMTDPKGK